jgi:glycosyltransferase involved in cell wall biosynthesis
MRLLALCEDPPDASVRTANGSTLVPASILVRLPDDVEIDLVCFDDGRRRLDPALQSRCRSVVRLPLRSARASAVAALLSPLPRATWRRGGRKAVSRVAELSRDADVLYVHGLHAFGVGVRIQHRLRRPALFSEMDHWSENIRQRAEGLKGLRRRYALVQRARTQNLERAASAVADFYVVVALPDAERLARTLGRSVDAVPNGVAASRSSDGGTWNGAPTLGFLGTLDYPPNVDAVTRLVTEVLPLVRARLPEATVVVAGRKLGHAIERLAGPTVTIVGEVPDAGSFYRSVGVMVYPGELGTGAKNTVAEAIAAGAAVVASSVAARSLPVVGQLVVADGPAGIADAVVPLLQDGAARAQLCRTAAAWGAQTPTWEAAAARCNEMLRSAVSAHSALHR